MASVMQGDAYNIPVTIKSGNGTLITPAIAACVEITVGQFSKRWPGQVEFDEKAGEWQFPVTQKQTFRFAPGAAVVQARVVFQDGSIMGGSGAPVSVEQSASRGTLPQPEKTEAVTGSAPKTTEVTIPTVHDIDVSLHSQVILSDPIKAPYIGDNGNWYEYDAETGTFVDTGTSASGTPPITPDTAGKYLTNDGSKAEWAKVEALPEGGKEGQVLTKKSDANGDAEWQNAAQSDWLEIDESSPSYIKNKLGGYYEADFENKAFNPVYFLNPPNNLIELKFDTVPYDDDVYYLSIDYDENVAFDGELKQTCFVTFETLNDKNNNLSFYISRYSSKQYEVHEKYGQIKSIDGYLTNVVPWDSSFIPVANNANYGAVKVSENISPDDINFQAIGIDKNGYLRSRKGTKVIASLTSDNLSDLFVSVGTLFTVSSSTYLEEKLGLSSLDFPVFIANTEIEYGYTYPHFIFLLFTKTNKSGEFILTPRGELINYAITTSTSLGISGATTGKIAKIKAVDTEGKPTEWEQADLPESNLFLVHLIQGELDSDGNPTYTVDKTFAEIKAAYNAGKKVELIPPADNQTFIVAVGSAPFEVASVTTETIDFQSIGVSPVGISDLPVWMLGGMPLGIISVRISSDEKVSVKFPFSVDGDTGMPVWHMVQKLPQQYVVSVAAGTDGTLSANNTLAQLQSVAQAYSQATDIIGAASINATYNGKLYYMSAAAGASVTFTATTENGLETLTVSNDGKEGSTDVWTHEVVPLGSPTDISLGLTAATIGQTIKVKAVDTDGKPTAWEAVDMTGGGEKPWQKVIDAEVTEPTGAFVANNLNGATEFHIRWSDLQNASDLNSGLNIVVNGIELCAPGVAAVVQKKGSSIFGWTYFKFDGLFWMTCRSNGAISAQNYKVSYMNTIYNLKENVGAADTVKFSSPTSGYSPVSGKLEVWAR
nr:MAG TPA: hypothetical protein [Caudoviricetes sp.]